MWWGKSSDKAKEPSSEGKQIPKDAAKSTTPPPAEKPAAPKVFDPTLPEREKLPPKLQKIVDKDDESESFYGEIVSGYARESTDTNLRYAAYATRIRTILLSAHRYVAYTSDIGESFRPVAHPNLVRTAYGISWLYLVGDVSYEGYKAYWQNQRILNPQLVLTPRQERLAGIRSHDAVTATEGPAAAAAAPGVVTPLEDYRTVMVQRAIFQSIASMGLPAFTIHSVVRYSGRALKNAKNAKIRTWAPIGLGLAVVPFLPMLFDKPVENAVEYVFHKGFQAFGGREYVGDAPTTGREKKLIQKPDKGDKEL